MKDFKDFLTEYSRFTITDDPRDESRKAVEMILTHMGGPPLKNGSTVDGSSKYQVLLEMMKDDARDGVKYLKKEYQRFSNELKSLSENEKIRELMDQMARLATELKEASRETRDKITSEIIPMLEKEIESVASLVTDDTARNLVRVFFLQEQLKTQGNKKDFKSAIGGAEAGLSDDEKAARNASWKTFAETNGGMRLVRSGLRVRVGQW